jgi:hypothetical protein
VGKSRPKGGVAHRSDRTGQRPFVGAGNEERWASQRRCPPYRAFVGRPPAGRPGWHPCDTPIVGWAKAARRAALPTITPETDNAGWRINHGVPTGIGRCTIHRWWATRVGESTMGYRQTSVDAPPSDGGQRRFAAFAHPTALPKSKAHPPLFQPEEEACAGCRGGRRHPGSRCPPIA